MQPGLLGKILGSGLVVVGGSYLLVLVVVEAMSREKEELSVVPGVVVMDVEDASLWKGRVGRKVVSMMCVRYL